MTWRGIALSSLLKLEYNKRVCENKDFCGVVMPSKDTKILEFNQCLKSEKMANIIYVDLESLIKNVDGCKSNFEKSSTTKAGEPIPCGYPVSTIWTFGGIENNKHNGCRSEDCRKNFGESFRELAMKIINFEKRNVIPLTKEQSELHEKKSVSLS